MESAQMGAYTLILAAGVQVAAGRLDRARSLLNHPIVIPALIRLSPELWPLLDEPPFAPRRSPLTLVWPKEAPPPPAGMDQLFQEIRFESAMGPPGR